MIGAIALSGRPRLKLSSSVNIVCDGDSLTAGVGGYPWPTGLKSRAGFGVTTVTNVAQSGQTWLQMNGGGGTTEDVDGAWATGKTNVLAPWAGTNDLALAGRTAQQTYQLAVDYITARQSIAMSRHGAKWIVLAGTLLPRQVSSSEADTVALNHVIDAYNALVLANYRAMGAGGVFDVRKAGSPFNVPDYTYASFAGALASGYWSNGDPANALTHLSSTGYDALLNQMITAAFARLPAR